MSLFLTFCVFWDILSEGWQSILFQMSFPLLGDLPLKSGVCFSKVPSPVARAFTAALTHLENLM